MSILDIITCGQLEKTVLNFCLVVWRLYGWTTLRRDLIYRKVYCTLKHHNPTFEKKDDFLELFCLLIIEFHFQKTVILKTTISQLK